MGQLYDADILEWSEHQVRLLRQRLEGKPGSEAPDWPNIIEEIESVGRGQLSAVKTLLSQALAYDLKCQAWPQAPNIPHWQAEARGLRGDAAEAYTPSMRQRIDVADLYRRALARLPDTIDGQAPLPPLTTCDLTLDNLLRQPAPESSAP